MISADPGELRWVGHATAAALDLHRQRGFTSVISTFPPLATHLVARRLKRKLGVHWVADIMGMPIGIDMRDEHVDPVALDDAFDWFRWVDATFSTYRPESEISRINRGELTVANAHVEVQSILARCEELKADTDGYFDITTVQLPDSGLAGTGSSKTDETRVPPRS